MVDKLGCKRALIIGTLLILITDIMLFHARDFSDFLLVIVVDGLSQALCNNSDALIISRVLLSQKSLTHLRQLKSLSWWLRNVALVFSSLAGGAIASYSNLYLPLLISMAAVTVSLGGINLLPRHRQARHIIYCKRPPIKLLCRCCQSCLIATTGYVILSPGYFSTRWIPSAT
ncbi:TPA: hypothetical protein OTX73_004521 [Escherichia coli]|nr:hypothetical protein [Escherichia coli]HDJ9303236.1 hypothetical protein [Escherichia coli]